MMGMTWYLVGLLLGLSGYYLLRQRIQHNVGWSSLSITGVGIGLILFALAWGVASILEGVPRAASMGMLLFGLPGIGLTTYGGRLIVKARIVQLDQLAEGSEP